MKKLVIIPTYNERENVARMIDKMLSLEGDFEVLFVDDGSPDGTAAIVRERMALTPDRIHLIERSGKLGDERFRNGSFGGKRGVFPLFQLARGDFVDAFPIGIAILTDADHFSLIGKRHHAHSPAVLAIFPHTFPTVGENDVVLIEVKHLAVEDQLA